MIQTNADEFQVSPDLRFVLLSKSRAKGSGTDHGTKYWIWGVETGYSAPLRIGSDGGHPTVQFALWMPAGAGDQLRSALLVAKENNLYYLPRADGSETYPITTDGRPDLFHGVSDPLHTDHILGSTVASWPSPGGSHILYLSVDAGAVRGWPYAVYGTTAGTPPSVYTVSCPRAGDVNPTLRVTVVEVSRPQQMINHVISPPRQLGSGAAYAAGVRWMDDAHVSITWYNRRQNASYVSLCTSPEWRCTLLYQTVVEMGWVEVGPAPVFCADDPAALLLVRAEADGGRRRIVRVNITAGRTEVVSIEDDVEKVLACGAKYMYYLSSRTDRPGQRHLFRIPANLSAAPHCMTCDLPRDAHPPLSHDCLHLDALFTENAQHYAILCEGPAVPHVTATSVGRSQVALLRNNSALRADVAAASLAPVRPLFVPLSAGGRASVRLTVPPQYRETDLVSYSLLVRVAFDPSEPPGADGVAWSVDWPAYLASQRQTVVADVTLPVRSTGEWSPASDTSSLREVVEGLLSQLKFVDAQRVAVEGRGLGALLALRLLAQPASVVSCAVAFAPITSWHSYGKD
ncbi:prolyl endopeptidase FAP-like [Amphibalanus amphitrite]|uniref:prolyl endopeptidase FAP-like n=1 Tax=Amphibalanus amphitrite TaxID=1232801 RepID=UPI001C90DD79|nr:prolyl endopeptidase FAP-like [Amphibalanus amphitrite]